MELQSTKSVSVSMDNAYINKDMLDILREMYVKQVKSKVLRLFIFCYLYERAQGVIWK